MDDINSPVEVEENEYVNQLTLSFLISKNQLQKLNKLKQKQHEEPIYNKERVNDLFTQLLNNERPDDLLEDVKTCFDAFIEKSIYYLEIHDKNLLIQSSRCKEQVEVEDDLDKDDDELEYENEDKDDDENEDKDDDENEDKDDENEDKDDENEKVLEEPIACAKKHNKSKGVDDIQKLPLGWFDSTRQKYKINQILPRKKEISIK
jgi:hypothetical protein